MKMKISSGRYKSSKHVMRMERRRDEHQGQCYLYGGEYVISLDVKTHVPIYCENIWVMNIEYQESVKIKRFLITTLFILDSPYDFEKGCD